MEMNWRIEAPSACIDGMERWTAGPGKKLIGAQNELALTFDPSWPSLCI